MSVDDVETSAKHRSRTKKRQRAGRALLACVVAGAMVVGLSAVFFYRHLNDNVTYLDISGELGSSRPARVAPGDPINVLVMGSDSRAGDQGTKQLEEGGARSDTTILMHLSANRKFAYGISLPRDAMVDRPACKTHTQHIPAEQDEMFNSAFSLGGVACTVKTVESLTGVHIDHWVVVNFNGFKDMVDAIGGVEVCVPHAIDDDRYQMHLTAGTQNIRGQAALDYVRVRHGFGDGSDIGRMKRQQAFIASMAARVVSAGTLTHVSRLVKFMDAATKSLALDTGVGNVIDLAKLGNSFRDIGLKHIRFITVPWESYAPDPNRIQWNTALADKLWAKVRHDQPLTKQLSDDAISAEQQASPSATASGSASAGASTGASAGASASAGSSAGSTSSESAAQAEADGLCS